MKRLLLSLALLGSAVVLEGCPIYSGNQESAVCDSQACYSCPGTTYTSSCTPLACQSDYDCPEGYLCDPNALACVAPGSLTGGDGGSDGSSSGCASTGCPSGQICRLANGTLSCVPIEGDGDSSTTPEAGSDSTTPMGDSSTDGGTDSSSDAPSEGAALDAPSDSSDGGLLGGPCNDDTTCGGGGARCIDGQCHAQVQLCSDGSQCNAAGFSCVNGLCEPACSSTHSSCPAGYACDINRDVCNVNPAPCTGSGTSTCQGGTVCVETHCVAPCGTGDSGASCPQSMVCVNGGCLPDQAATFTCTNDGVSGPVANKCSANDVCIHHDCYTSCNGDAGACDGKQSTGNTCKSVTIETGTYAVCGTTTTLGSECDPSQGEGCTGSAICVNGYCL